MKRDPATLAADFDRLIAEVVALRNRVAVQYKLIEFLCDGHSVGGDDIQSKSKSVCLDDILPRLNAPQGVDLSIVGSLQESRPHGGDDSIVGGGDWWPLRASEPKPLRASHGWGLLATPPEARYVGFVVCGVSAAELERAVTRVASVQRAWSGFVPLFMTDSTHLAIFRKFGFAVEVLSSPQQSDGIQTDIHRSVVDQREFIARKWGLAQVVDFGHDLQNTDRSDTDYGSLLNVIQSQSSVALVQEETPQA